MQMESQVIQVNIDDIIPNRFQPRISFDEKALNELAASIKEHGIIQPLVLRKLGNKFEIIAGERRYKASVMAGLQTVPAVISNIDDNKSAEVALVENIQRKDLTPIEEARSYKTLLDKGYLTQEQLAKKMGLSQSTVSNKLRLLNLDNKVQQALLDEKISERHARSLLKITNPEDQKKMLDRIIKERLTVKKLDEIIKKEYANNDKEVVDVPLVNIPNIEEIKEQATDINSNNKKVEEKMENNNVEQVNNPEINASVNQIPVENVEAPNTNSFANINEGQQEVLKTVPPIENKFFNPLEDTPVEMTNLNPFANDANFTVDQTSTQDSEVEVFDVATTPTPEATTPIMNQNNATPAPEVNQPIINDSFNQINNFNEPMMQNPTSTVNELNPNNKFFQPIQEPTISGPSIDDDMYSAPINPMDNVNNLMNENSPVADQQDYDLGDAINDIRGKVEEINSKGLNVSIDEADLETSYQMNISIMK